jgi:hypothetical protein
VRRLSVSQPVPFDALSLDSRHAARNIFSSIPMVLKMLFAQFGRVERMPSNRSFEVIERDIRFRASSTAWTITLANSKMASDLLLGRLIEVTCRRCLS